MATNAFPAPSSFFTRSQLFTSSGTFSHPDGYGSARSVFVVVCGGGGGGGSGCVQCAVATTGWAFLGGGGGGSGVVNAGYLQITADQTVTIGAGGTGGTAVGTTTGASGNIGVAGGNSSFGNLIGYGGGRGVEGIASSSRADHITDANSYGGSGGGIYTRGTSQTAGADSPATAISDSRYGGQYGAAKYVSVSATIWLIFGGQGVSNIYNGGNGTYYPTPSSTLGLYIPGGGGMGASGRNSTTAYTATGNPGGSGYFGSGGTGGNSSHTISTNPATGTAGSAGTGYGAGGGGGGCATTVGTPATNSTSGAGGAGTSGYVLVFY